MERILDEIREITAISKIFIGSRPHPLHTRARGTSKMDLVVVKFDKTITSGAEFLQTLRNRLAAKHWNVELSNPPGDYVPALIVRNVGKRDYAIGVPVRNRGKWEVHVLPEGFLGRALKWKRDFLANATRRV